MLWDKIKKEHYHTTPVEYFRTSSIFSQIEYEKLYENQNYLEHKYWQNLSALLHMPWTYHIDLGSVNRDVAVTCLWFFKDRADRNSGNYITCKDKVIVYGPNTFFFTKFKDYMIMPKKDNILNRPTVQLHMTEQQYQTILDRFQ